MFRIAITLLAVAPAALTLAPLSAGDAQVNASSQPVTTVDAEIAAARAWRLPEQPIIRRVNEGRAKGASEAQLAIDAHRVRLTMEGALSAMVGAGRLKPTDDELEHGGSAMERGFTREELIAAAKSVPPDRSVVAAFDRLTRPGNPRATASLGADGVRRRRPPPR